MTLLIIGYRCSGKTTLGKALSKSYKVIDIDQLIMDKTQKTLPELTNNGENLEPFRHLETEILQDLLDNNQSKIVIASGGTGVNNTLDFGQKQFEIIKNSLDVKVVWLNTPIELISKRLMEDFENPNSHRPELKTLSNINTENYIGNKHQLRLNSELEIYTSRISKYLALADNVVTEIDLTKLVSIIEGILNN